MDDQAISSTVGVALLIGIVFAGVAAVTVTGISILDDQQSEISSETVIDQFEGISADIGSVLQSSERATSTYEYPEGGSPSVVDGSHLTILKRSPPGWGVANCVRGSGADREVKSPPCLGSWKPVYDNPPLPSDQTLFDGDIGTIEYQLKDGAKIVYELQGTIRTSEDGSQTFVNPPLFQIESRGSSSKTVSLQVVRFHPDSANSVSDTVTVHNEGHSTIHEESIVSEDDMIQLRIQTRFPYAYDKYFVEEEDGVTRSDVRLVDSNPSDALKTVIVNLDRERGGSGTVLYTNFNVDVIRLET